jgi:type IV pilus assembly protein PilY1
MMKKLLAILLSCLVIVYANSEDIELYLGDASYLTGNRPQVLIIFDNSGSMGADLTIKTPYNPNRSDRYGATNNDIYYVKGSGLVEADLHPTAAEKRKFPTLINSCKTAQEKLAKLGYYTGRIREYKFQGHSGSWQEIPADDGSAIAIIDCEDDLNNWTDNSDINTGYIRKSDGSLASLPEDKKDGYPVNGLGTADDAIYYTDTIGNSNVSWTGETVTLYTESYLRWYYKDKSEVGTSDSTRMQVAKDVITDLIESAPAIDFGLQVFNYNRDSRYDGGRIVSGIKGMNRTTQSELTAMVDSLTPYTWTPLCETLYEAYNYFAGKNVFYGGEAHPSGRPVRDTSVERGAAYISPFEGRCNSEVFVIYMTDGAATRDDDANTKVASLPGVSAPYLSSYLPALSEWLHTHDVNDDLDGTQIVSTHTIGFGDAFDDIDDPGVNDQTKILAKTAVGGGGKYYSAKDPTSLLNSLQSILADVSKSDASFSAPSVGTNNFDKTKTLDYVYYGMFTPDRGPRWQGNIKKLKISGSDQLDRDGNNAIDPITKNISDTAKTYWPSTTEPDGNSVDKGGVAGKLRSQTTRKIYSDNAGSTSLVTLTKSNAESAFGGSAALASKMGVPEDEIEANLSWAKGIDVDDADSDDDRAENRFDIFADPLHSKPLVINYGGSPTADIRIVVGTNAGVLHMFKDTGDDISESWAFMPKEFFKNIKKLRNNYASTNKVYGIDGSATAYTADNNNDGIIDKAWIFIGLRRGGDSYYAVDVSNPDSPRLMWKINSDSAGFSELGQTWSQPKIAYSTINIVAGVPKPVLIFAGGYSINKDSSGVGSNDSVGRAIYMVDAESGNLLWSATPTGGDVLFPGVDSIPSSVAVLDSDQDGLVDRLYVGDTGGNVWRVDMPGIDKTQWTVIKLAELGGNDLANDRRFFSEPSIVRTFITETTQSTVAVDGIPTSVITRHERPYDAILLGSGDRTAPLSDDTQDKLFMIKDEHILTTSFVVGGDNPPPDTIKVDDLYDYTSDPFGIYVPPLSPSEKSALQTLQLAVSAKSGWFIDLDSGGEKSTSSPIAIDGVAYFTSFKPAASDEGSCQIAPVSGNLYAVDLALGTTVYHWTDRIIKTVEGIPATPTLIITDDPDTGTTEPCTGDDCPPEVKKNATAKILIDKTLVAVPTSLETWQNYIFVRE